MEEIDDKVVPSLCSGQNDLLWNWEKYPRICVKMSTPCEIYWREIAEPKLSIIVNDKELG